MVQLIINLLDQDCKFWFQLNGFVVRLWLLEELVVLEVCYRPTTFRVVIQRVLEDVSQPIVFNHVDEAVFVALVDQSAQIFESMRHLHIWRDHLKEHQPKAVDVVFASLLLVLEQDALVDFWLLWIKERDLPYSKIADFDVTVVWIDVNGFASQLAVDQLILVEELETLKDLVAPVLDHDESRQSYLLDVLPNGSCCNQLGNQNKLRTNCRYLSLLVRPQSNILILWLALITLIWWNTPINFTVLTRRDHLEVGDVH